MAKKIITVQDKGGDMRRAAFFVLGILCVLMLWSPACRAESVGDLLKSVVDSEIELKCTQVMNGKCITHFFRHKDNHSYQIFTGKLEDPTPPAEPPQEYPIVLAVTDFNENDGWTLSGEWLETEDLGVNLGTEIADAPMFSFNITVSSSGIYYIWVRGEGPDASGDSVNYGADGIRIATITFLDRPWSNFTQYTKETAILDLTDGDHVLNFWQREDGTRILEIRITDDQSYTP